MSKKTTRIIAITAVSLAALAGGSFAIWNVLSHQKFRLDGEYYATSEMIDLDKAGYEDLISQNKSFVVLIDKPGCTTTVAMRENMAAFPSNIQFRYYRMMWDEVKASSLHEKVKFTPSVALIKNGEVTKWLQADRDEDSDYFNSGEALQRWITDNIEF